MRTKGQILNTQQYRLCLRATIIAQLVFCSGSALASYPNSLNEQFTTSSIDSCLVSLSPAWHTQTPGYNSGGSISFANGRMTTTTATTASHAGKFSQFVLTGDFDIRARLSRPASGTGSNGSMSLGIHDPINNIASAIVLSGDNYVWTNTNYDTSSAANGSTNFISSTSSTLDVRIKRDGSTITYFYKSTSTPLADSSWTQHGSSVSYTHSGSSVYVGVYAQLWSPSGSTTISAYVDELNIDGTFAALPVTLTPESILRNSGVSGPFSIQASMNLGTGGYNPAQGTFSYQWQVEVTPGTWMNLSNNGNGRSGSSSISIDSTLSSGRVSQLTVSNPTPADTGKYRCLITNACINATSSVCLVTIGSTTRCAPSDIAYDDGVSLPPNGPSTGTNNGVNEGDYNCFFGSEGFFFQTELGSLGIALSCDIANDDGSPLPPFGPSGGTNNGVTEGDYNCFFNFFFTNECLS